MPPFEWLTEDRPLPNKSSQPNCCSSATSWRGLFMKMMTSRAGRDGLTCGNSRYGTADDAGPQARAGPPPDLTWRWLAELAEFAAEEGNVSYRRMPWGACCTGSCSTATCTTSLRAGRPGCARRWLAQESRPRWPPSPCAACSCCPAGRGCFTTGAASGPLPIWRCSRRKRSTVWGRDGLLTRELAALAGIPWLSTAGTRDGGRRSRVTEAHSYRGHSVRRGDPGRRRSSRKTSV